MLKTLSHINLFKLFADDANNFFVTINRLMIGVCVYFCFQQWFWIVLEDKNAIKAEH